MASTVVLRRTREKTGGEALGGVGAPIVKFAGPGNLVLGPRAAHILMGFRVDDTIAGSPIFLREESLLGFEMKLEHESGRIAIGDGEMAHVVQLRGAGVVLVELAGRLGATQVLPARTATVRREGIVGWTGRLVPRALTPAEAPAGQHGLVSFAGEGTVLVSS
jgi:uncharacterized protein (AIM24 family)